MRFKPRSGGERNEGQGVIVVLVGSADMALLMRQRARPVNRPVLPKLVSGLRTALEWVYVIL